MILIFMKNSIVYRRKISPPKRRDPNNLNGLKKKVVSKLILIIQILNIKFKFDIWCGDS